MQCRMMVDRRVRTRRAVALVGLTGLLVGLTGCVEDDNISEGLEPDAGGSVGEDFDSEVPRPDPDAGPTTDLGLELDVGPDLGSDPDAGPDPDAAPDPDADPIFHDVVAIIAPLSTVEVGELLSLDGSGSRGPEGVELRYTWRVTDVQGNAIPTEPADGPSVTVRPARAGFHTVELTVSTVGAERPQETTDTATARFLVCDGAVTLRARDVPPLQRLGGSGGECVDFIIDGAVSLTEPFEIEPGTRIAFTENSGWRIRAGGALTARGTAEAPIVFTGSSAVPGHWVGVHFDGSINEDNILEHVTLEHGGARGWLGGSTARANLLVGGGATLAVRHLTSRRSAAYGLNAWSDGVLVDLSDVHFAHNAAGPAIVSPHHPPTFGSDWTFEPEGEDGRVHVRGGTLVAGEHDWPALPVPYQVAGIVTVRGDWRIAPGTALRFTPDGVVTVNGGALTAVGTEEAPIRFLGEEEVSGYWDGIWLRDSGGVTRFEHVEIAHGGRRSPENRGSLPRANLVVGGATVNERAQVTIAHARIERSGGWGVAVNSRGELIEVDHTRFADNDGALALLPGHVRHLRPTLTFEGEGPHTIAVGAGTLDTGEHTWPTLEPPYRVDGLITVASPWTISAGATLRFSIDGAVTVRSAGTLRAVGTPEAPIHLGGVDAAPGAWDGIWIRDSLGANVLEHVRVTDGGRRGPEGRGLTPANVYVGGVTQLEEGRIAIRHAELRDGAGMGLVVNSRGHLDALEGSSVTGNARGILEVRAQHVGAIDPEGTYEGDRDDRAILVVTGGTVDDGATWGVTTVPYQIEADLPVDAALTLAPGTHLRFAPNSGLAVTPLGALNAVGEPDRRITLGGLPNAAPGSWRGVWIRSNSLLNELRHVTITHGGASGRGGGAPASGNLVVGQANLTARVEVRDATLAHARPGSGLWVHADSVVNGDACEVNELVDNDGANCVIP